MTPPLERLITTQPRGGGRILALDPGETTGWCCTTTDRLLPVAGQGKVPISALDEFLDSFQPTQVVAEDYRVYATHVEQHVASALPTVRLLGAIEHWCSQHEVSLTLQMAGPVKAFVTDEKLKDWNLYQKGVRHGMDATRHLVYYLVFGPGREGRKKPQPEANSQSRRSKYHRGVG